MSRLSAIFDRPKIRTIDASLGYYEKQKLSQAWSYMLQLATIGMQWQHSRRTHLAAIASRDHVGEMHFNKDCRSYGDACRPGVLKS